MNTLKKSEFGTFIMKIQTGDNLSLSEKLELLSPEQLQLKMKTERDLFHEYLGFLQLPANSNLYVPVIEQYRYEIIEILRMIDISITCKDEIIEHLKNLYHFSKIASGKFMKYGLIESFKNFKIEQANRWKNYKCNC
jgi:hypothetical protein